MQPPPGVTSGCFDHEDAMLGLATILFSGLLIASFAAPMKLSRTWNWENSWLVYATLALLLIPAALVLWAIPDPIAFYAAVPLRTLLPSLLFGFGWGIAQVTFGLSIARVGMAMAFAIVVGLSSLLGSAIPLAVFHPGDLASRPGAVLLASGVLLFAGLAVYVDADRKRGTSAGATGSARGVFLSGVLLCVFTGCFGSMINMGFVFGGDIAQQAIRNGIPAGKATLSVWAVGLFRKSLGREFLLALAAAALWLFGMLGYGVGAGEMGKYGNSIGFAVFMAVMLLWSSALGLIAGEWKSACSVAVMRMRVGLVLIVVSMSVLGIGAMVRK
jgi:L-rhamnose-H+ transport protein